MSITRENRGSNNPRLSTPSVDFVSCNLVHACWALVWGIKLSDRGVIWTPPSNTRTIPLFLHIPPLIALVQGEKALCPWGYGLTTPSTPTTARGPMGKGHPTFSTGTHRGQCKLLLVIAQPGKNILPPPTLIIIKNFIQSHAFSSLTYRHTLPKRKTHLSIGS